MSLTGKWFGFGKNPDYDAGVRALERGEWLSAIESFHAALRGAGDPTVGRMARFSLMESYRRLSIELLERGDAEGAVGAADAAIAIRPDYADLYVLSGRALASLGRWEPARQATSHALVLNPRYRDALVLSALIAYGEEPNVLSLSALGAAMASTPAFAAAWPATDAAHGAGDPKLAVNTVLGAFGSGADEANTRANYAALLVREGQLDEALEAYAAAVELAPRYPDIRCRYGQALLEADRVEEALAEFEAALAVNESYVEAWAQKGIALKRLGRVEEAKAAFAEAVRRDPVHPIAAMETGRL